MGLALFPSNNPAPIIERMLAITQGGGDGVIRGQRNEGAVAAQAPLSLSVDVGSFSGYASFRIANLPSDSSIGPVEDVVNGVAPAERRIDLVQWTVGIGLNIKTGVNGSSPVAPATDSDSIVLAHIHNRKGQASIKDAETATFGWIDNTVRNFV